MSIKTQSTPDLQLGNIAEFKDHRNKLKKKWSRLVDVSFVMEDALNRVACSAGDIILDDSKLGDAYSGMFHSIKRFRKVVECEIDRTESLVFPKTKKGE